MRKSLILGLMLITMVMLSGCKTKVDLQDYTDVEFSGIDGKGKVSVGFSEDLLKKLYEDDIDGAEDMDVEDLVEKVADSDDLKDKAKDLNKALKCSVDKKEGLSNGDKVTISYTVDEDVAEKYDLKFESEDKEVEVKGLTELEEVDVFEGLKIDYSGISPDVSVTVSSDSDNSLLKDANYTVEPSSGLKVGDKFTVTIDCTESEMEKSGYQPKEMSKEYTVDKADYYIEDYSLIDDETMKKMKTQATDLIEAKFANDDYYEYVYKTLSNPPFTSSYDYYQQADVSSVKISCEPYKNYFLVKKDMSYIGYEEYYNQLFMVYKVNFTDKYFKETKILYLPVLFKNFKMLDTGKLDVIVTDGALWYGDDNLDNTTRTLVTDNKDIYTCTENEFK